MHRWTEAEKEYVRQHVKGTLIADLIKTFNEEFNTDVTYDQMRACVKNMKLKSGVDTRIHSLVMRKHLERNWIKKGEHRSLKTEFYKGHLPYNYKPIGCITYRKNPGYMFIKVAEKSPWKLLQRQVWEENNGPIPKGSRIWFLDGDTKNCDIDNLVLVTETEAAFICRSKLWGKDPDINRSVLAAAKLRAAISKRTNEQRQKDTES